MSKNNNNLKLVVFVARSHIGSTLTVNHLINSGINIEAIIKSRNFVGKSKLKSITTSLRIMGWRRSLYYLFVAAYMKIKFKYARLLTLFGRRQKIITYNQIKKRYSIPIIKTKDINSAESIRKIKKLQPDIVLVCYFNQILKKEVINIPKYGCFNIHPSLVQNYRGLNNYFWVLANNETITGVTTHKIDEGIDTGQIVAQKEIDIGKDDTEFGLLIKISKEGAKLFVDSIDNIKEGRFSVSDTSKSKYYSLPTRKVYNRFLRLGRKVFKINDFDGLF
jgi:folate-dependent phosphoribosylglycinamide formyltransferase PurN